MRLAEGRSGQVESGVEKQNNYNKVADVLSICHFYCIGLIKINLFASADAVADGSIDP